MKDFSDKELKDIAIKMSKMSEEELEKYYDTFEYYRFAMTVAHGAFPKREKENTEDKKDATITKTKKIQHKKKKKNFENIIVFLANTIFMFFLGVYFGSLNNILGYILGGFCLLDIFCFFTIFSNEK